MSDETPSKPADVVLLGPPTADGAGVHVLRAREERLEAGELRTVEDGKPLRGELVSLSPRKDDPRVCDVTSSYTPPAPASAKAAPSPAAPAKAKKGPAQVASPTYRERWDDIFGTATEGAREARPDRSLN